MAVAALSARALAEWARDDGRPVLALDVFGDADTRRAAAGWHDIGTGTGVRIGAHPLLQALSQPGLDAWVAGSGFEDDPGLLHAAAQRLPLLGTSPAQQRRLADPRIFIGALNALGLRHPETRFEVPSPVAGWLCKAAGGRGGQGVARATAAQAESDGCWQRECAGTPMSATFIADGTQARVLGFNRQWFVPQGDRPYLFAGIAGPLAVADGVRADVQRALARLVPEFQVLGLGSLDFLLIDGEVLLLELNARPPASAAFYGGGPGDSPLNRHVRACRMRQLPPETPLAPRVRGLHIVRARRPLTLGRLALDWLASQPGTHDLPAGPQTFEAGAPVCTLSGRQTRLPARGDSGDPAILNELMQRESTLLRRLETFS